MDKLEFIFQISEKAFQAEQDRMKNLTDKAEKYISAVAVIIGFQLLNINSMELTEVRSLHNWLAVFGLFLLGIAFLNAVASNRIQNYASYPDSKVLLAAFEDETIDKDSAKAGFTKMYLDALAKNLLINDQRAKLLSISGNLITIGFGFIVVRFILEMIIK